jgi:hypothetical protein
MNVLFSAVAEHQDFDAIRATDRKTNEGVNDMRELVGNLNITDEDFPFPELIFLT